MISFIDEEAVLDHKEAMSIKHVFSDVSIGLIELLSSQADGLWGHHAPR